MRFRQPPARPRHRWTVYPAQIFISILCIVVSRFAHFIPGFVFGLAGDVEPRKSISVGDGAEPSRGSRRRCSRFGLASWFVSIPVGSASLEPGAGFALRTFDTLLAVVAVVGMEVLVFALAPFPLPRRLRPVQVEARLYGRSFWGTGLVEFAFVILNPALASTRRGASVAGRELTNLLFEALAAVAIWFYFLSRRRRQESGVSGAPVRSPAASR